MIKQRITENDTLLFALDRQWQQLLLATADRFQWQATYRIGGYDFADWETLRAIAEKGTNDLMGGIMLSDIIDYIDEIETKLDTLINLTGCCPPDGVTTFFAPAPLPATPDYPYDGETYPVLYAGLTMDDLADYQAHLCGAANSMIDNIVAGLNNVQAQWSVGGAIFGVVAAFLSLVAGFTLIGIPVAIAIATGSSAAIIAAGAGIAGLFSGAADDIEDARNALICLALHDTPANFAAGMEALVSTLAWSTLLQYLNYNDMIASLYSGQVAGENITVTPTTENCNCEPTYDFDETFTFDSDAESFTGSKGGWVSDYGGCLRCVPDGGGYTYLDYHEEDILTRLGLPNNTYLQIEAFDIVLHRNNVTIGGTPNFSVTAFADSGNEGYGVLCSNITTDTNGMLVHWEPTTPGTVYCQTPNQVNGFIRIHCQQGGAALPVVYVHSLRVRGWVNP